MPQHVKRRPRRGSLESVASREGYKVAATLSIRRAGEMSEHGRLQIAEWLLGKARDLIREGEQYSPRFTARYWYKARRGSRKPAKRLADAPRRLQTHDDRNLE